MSNYELGKTEPKFDVLLALSKFFGISVDDFLTKPFESGSTLKNVPLDVPIDVLIKPSSPSESGKSKGIIYEGKAKGKVEGKVSLENTIESGKSKSTNFDDYRNGYFNGYPDPLFLPESGKSKGINILEIPIAKSENPELVGVPVVDISVAAGSGFENPGYLSEVDAIYFPKSMIHDGQTYLCVRIKGDSMAPTLQDGGYLVIRMLDRSEWESIRDGHVYVVSDRDGRAYVKRLKNRLVKHGFIVCTSDNPDVTHYRNFNLMEDELNTVWYAEWYVSAKMPNIHTAYYNKVSDLEDKYDDIIHMIQNMQKDIKALQQ